MGSHEYADSSLPNALDLCFGRYGRRVDVFRLPVGDATRTEYALTIGADGFILLKNILSPAVPAWLRELSALRFLRAIWGQHFTRQDDEVGMVAATVSEGQAGVTSSMSSPVACAVAARSSTTVRSAVIVGSADGSTGGRERWVAEVVDGLADHSVHSLAR